MGNRLGSDSRLDFDLAGREVGRLLQKESDLAANVSDGQGIVEGQSMTGMESGGDDFDAGPDG